MSFSFDKSIFSEDKKIEIHDSLIVSPILDKHNYNKQFLYLYSIKNKECILPFYYSFKNFNELCVSHIKKLRKEIHRSSYTFNGTLRKIQEECIKEILINLKKYRTCIINLYVGIGKSIIFIYLSYFLKFSSLFLYHRNVIGDQIVSAIKYYCPNAKIQEIDSNCEIEKDIDFYICSYITLYNRVQKGHEVIKVGMCCVDECHSLCSSIHCKILDGVRSLYSIGMSATIIRPDGLEKILDLYYGFDTIVKRELKRKFLLYKYNTNIKIIPKNNDRDELDWNDVLEQQCLNKERNELIRDIICRISNYAIFVLCKRKDQCKILYRMLLEYGENVDIYIASQRKFNYNTRILLSSYSKSGVGFNFLPKDKDGNLLKVCMIVASDVKELFEQYLGRVFRTDLMPMVIDIVDKFGLLNYHYNERDKIYKKVGAIKKDFNEDYADFEEWRKDIISVDIKEIK